MNERVVTDVLVVVGVLKDALLRRTRVELLRGGVATPCTVEAIEEAQPRDRTVGRAIALRPDDAATIPDGSAKIRVFTRRGVLGWEGAVEARPGGALVRVPPSAVLSDRRAEPRTAIRAGLVPELTVALEHGEDFTEGRFEVRDVATRGFGGRLLLPEHAVCAVGDRVRGRFRGELGGLVLDAVVAWVGPGVATPRGRRWTVGLVVARDRNAAATRVEPVRGTIRVRSPLAPDEPIALAVVAASWSGFVAEAPHAAAARVLAPGVEGTIEGGPRFVVDDVRELEVRARLEPGTEEAALGWAREVRGWWGAQPAVVVDADELFDLFLDSGAVAARFLDRQRLDGPDPGFAAGDRGLVFRWVERDRRGAPIAHASACPIGDDAWFAGEIAAARSSERRVELAGFMTGCAELLRTMERCPSLLGMWVDGHPFWRRAEEALRASSQVDWLSMRYQRAGPAGSGGPALTVRRLSARDAPDLARVRALVRSQAERALLDALDFSRSALGSRRLRERYESRGMAFRREYLLVLREDRPVALAVVSAFPPGTSVNRTLDAAWIFALSPVTAGTEDEVRRAVQHEALRLGIGTIGFLESAEGPTDRVEVTKRLFVWVGRPDAIIDALA